MQAPWVLPSHTDLSAYHVEYLPTRHKGSLQLWTPRGNGPDNGNEAFQPPSVGVWHKRNIAMNLPASQPGRPGAQYLLVSSNKIFPLIDMSDVIDGDLARNWPGSVRRQIVLYLFAQCPTLPFLSHRPKNGDVSHRGYWHTQEIL